jgi:pimeloyl-ACP methyl ester carboxylesterase
MSMIFKYGLRYRGGPEYLQCELNNYFIDHIKVGKELFITFESAGEPQYRPMGSRKPWGFDFLIKRGFSVLGVKIKQVDWYRHPSIHTFFRSDIFNDIVSSYDKVYLYGSSMGGFAALTFAEAVPGCTVIAVNPQSTLDPEIVPWESRWWGDGREQDWKGDFADGAIGAKFAKTVYVVYDPFHLEDKKHILRLDQSNLIHLKLQLLGHRLPVWLQQMGILSDTIDLIVDNRMNEQVFYELARARRNLPRYFLKLAKARPGLQEYCAKEILKRDPNNADARNLLSNH